MGTSKFFDIDFFKRKNSNSFYVLGFFAADGSLSVTKRGGCYFSIYSKDKQIILDIKKAMKSKHKLSKRLNIVTGNYWYRIQIGSKYLCNDLVKIGFVGNKTKNIPRINLSKNQFKHFLRGYFDGDGNVWYGEIHKKRKTQHINVLLAFTSASKDFLMYLQENLKKYINTSGSLFSGKGEYYRLQYSKRDAFKIYDFMYNTDTSLLLLRKKEVFDKIVKVCGRSSTG